MEYLKNSYNFYESAYFYIYLFKEKKIIPYVNDAETVELISFLSSYSIRQILSDRELERKTLKQLPHLASKALLIN